MVSSFRTGGVKVPVIFTDSAEYASQKSNGQEKKERNQGILLIFRGVLCMNLRISQRSNNSGINRSDFIKRKSEQSL